MLAIRTDRQAVNYRKEDRNYPILSLFAVKTLKRDTAVKLRETLKRESSIEIIFN